MSSTVRKALGLDGRVAILFMLRFRRRSTDVSWLADLPGNFGRVGDAAYEKRWGTECVASNHHPADFKRTNSRRRSVDCAQFDRDGRHKLLYSHAITFDIIFWRRRIPRRQAVLGAVQVTGVTTV